MIAAGIVLMFMGYGVGSYGYVLVRGWDITLRQWFSPINPWQWPAGDIPKVPPGQIMPGAPPGSSSSGGGGGVSPGINAANPLGGASQSGAPQPGVQGTVAGGHGR